MSTVILDTITGKSTATTITIGSTPVVSASANSMTIRGEGSAQTSIQQGLAKSWLTMDGTGNVRINVRQHKLWHQVAWILHTSRELNQAGSEEAAFFVTTPLTMVV